MTLSLYDPLFSRFIHVTVGMTDKQSDPLWCALKDDQRLHWFFVFPLLSLTSWLTAERAGKQGWQPAGIHTYVWDCDICMYVCDTGGYTYKHTYIYTCIYTYIHGVVWPPGYTFLLPVMRININWQVLAGRRDKFALVDPVSIWRHGNWTRGSWFMIRENSIAPFLTSDFWNQW